jgi:hypothetical protein
LVRRKGVAWNWRCKYLAGIGEQKADLICVSEISDDTYS